MSTEVTFPQKEQHMTNIIYLQESTSATKSKTNSLNYRARLKMMNLQIRFITLIDIII